MKLEQLLQDWIGDDWTPRNGDNSRSAGYNEAKAELRASLPTLLAKIEQHVLEARKDELHNYRVEHAKHHDEEYCLDNFNNFTYVIDRIATLDALLNTKEEQP